MMLRKIKHISILFIAILFVSCEEKKKAPTDTTTRGEVNIVVDESFQKLLNNQIYTFESLYPDATINAAFLPENEALPRLINDSCKVVVICRDISAVERKQFEAKNIFPISTKIAEDAIAIVVNNSNSNTTFTVKQIKSILLGTDSLWSQLNPSLQKEKIAIVFDNKGSANTNYMKDSLLKGQKFSKNAFAVNTNAEVIAYVNKHPNAIGFISVNWISDRDDPKTIDMLNKVKLTAIAKDEHTKPVKPFQAFIKTKDYPFTRNVYMINRQTRAGLGMGFVSFVAGVKGQLMILKSGLIPAIPPTRLVKINTK